VVILLCVAPLECVFHRVVWLFACEFGLFHQMALSSVSDCVHGVFPSAPDYGALVVRLLQEGVSEDLVRVVMSHTTAAYAVSCGHGLVKDSPIPGVQNCFPSGFSQVDAGSSDVSECNLGVGSEVSSGSSVSSKRALRRARARERRNNGDSGSVSSASSAVTYAPGPGRSFGVSGDLHDWGDGYCYVGVVRPEAVSSARKALGARPTFAQILLSPDAWFDVQALARYYVTRGDGVYHVGKVGVVPVVLCLASILMSERRFVRVPGTLSASPVLQVSVSAVLVSKAPSSADRCGAHGVGEVLVGRLSGLTVGASRAVEGGNRCITSGGWSRVSVDDVMQSQDAIAAQGECLGCARKRGLGCAMRVGLVPPGGLVTLSRSELKKAETSVGAGGWIVTWGEPGSIEAYVAGTGDLLKGLTKSVVRDRDDELCVVVYQLDEPVLACAHSQRIKSGAFSIVVSAVRAIRAVFTGEGRLDDRMRAAFDRAYGKSVS